MWFIELARCSVIDVHLLDLLDGSPHEVPVQKVLPLDLGCSNKVTTYPRVSNSRIALLINFFSSAVVKEHKELVVWNWRTGEMVCCFVCFFAGGPHLNLPLDVSTLGR